MKSLTKNQVEKFAKIHIAVHLSGIDGIAFDDCGLNEADVQKCLNGVYKLAHKISNRLPTNFGTTKAILDYVRSNF